VTTVLAAAEVQLCRAAEGRAGKVPEAATATSE
jgi:hypothetical protein